MSQHVGRHRAAGRYNPATEITRIVSTAGTPVAKGAAVLAASGGLVAAIAVPASATGDDHVAAPAQGESVSASTAVAGPAAPAVTAPARSKKAPAAVTAFGKLDVEPVAKPTGPTPAQLRARAARKAAEERAERERAEREQAEREEAASADEQTQERTESAPSRSTTRTSPQPAAKPAPKPAAPAPSTGSRSDVIAVAKQYIGVPYVYGGSSPSGFDCSGFTQYVFNKVGVSLPRVTTAQQAAVTPVSSPQPGDLVFFGSPSWHVGIYVGDGMMIDAPRTGKSISIRPIFDGVSGYGRP